jgi:diguanylate cyclase (GGDEF)-like protein
LEQAHQTILEAYESLEVAHAIIQKQALTDALTNLPNHRALVDQLEQDLEHARRYKRPFSLLFFDADRFKQINDTYGHAAGDSTLQEIGIRTRRNLREGDTLGRFGGEEFVVLLPETDCQQAMLIAERIRSEVAASPISSPGLEEGISITLSIGISSYPEDGTSERELLSQADEAMYLAKRLGRNQVQVAQVPQQSLQPAG